MLMRNLLGLMPVAALLFGYSSVATAAETTRVATAGEKDNLFDLHFGVSYDYDFKKASILREWSVGNENRLAKDLIYRQRRQTVTPSLEFGIFHDISVYMSLPIVVSDRREYGFDQELGDECVYPGAGSSAGGATCVDKTNSSTIRDSIVPVDGFDARNTTDPYGQFTGADTALIFQGPRRQGIDQLHLGIKYKLLNQRKLSHMPNWVAGIEGRFAVGKAMKFTREIQIDDKPSNHAVGRGIHELGVWTALSRRYRYLDPFFGAYWRQSMSSNKSQFINYGGSQTSVNPQSTTGAYVGAEIVPWERKAKSQKVSILIRGSAELKYNGRGYSEIWELLADSPALVGTYDTAAHQCDAQPAVDYANDADNASNPGGYLDAANDAPGNSGCKAFTGITSIQDYGSFAIDVGLNFHLGPYARLNFGANLKTDTQHILTSASRGDADALSSGDNDLVDAGTAEVNPVRRDVIDTVGRRYAIDGVFRLVGYANFLVTF